MDKPYKVSIQATVENECAMEIGAIAEFEQELHFETLDEACNFYRMQRGILILLQRMTAVGR